MNGERLRIADYLEHILAAIEKIRRYTKEMDRAPWQEHVRDLIRGRLEAERVDCTTAQRVGLDPRRQQAKRVSVIVLDSGPNSHGHASGRVR